MYKKLCFNWEYAIFILNPSPIDRTIAQTS